MELHGKVILITRAASQSAELRDRLTALGARVIECPAIEITPPEDWSQVDQAISEMDTYHWLLFTSANAVDQFMTRLDLRGGRCTIQIAVVGTATAASLARWDKKASLIPESHRAEGLLEAFPHDLNGIRILFPRAATARELLPEELRRRGATVDVLPVYRTVQAANLVLDVLRLEKPDGVVFTSPSTIRFMDEALDGEMKSLFSKAAICVIGPVTRQAAQAVGLNPAVEPERATTADLVEAIRQHFAGRE